MVASDAIGGAIGGFAVSGAWKFTDFIIDNLFTRHRFIKEIRLIRPKFYTCKLSDYDSRINLEYAVEWRRLNKILSVSDHSEWGAFIRYKKERLENLLEIYNSVYKYGSHEIARFFCHVHRDDVSHVVRTMRSIRRSFIMGSIEDLRIRLNKHISLNIDLRSKDYESLVIPSFKLKESEQELVYIGIVNALYFLACFHEKIDNHCHNCLNEPDNEANSEVIIDSILNDPVVTDVLKKNDYRSCYEVINCINNKLSKKNATQARNILRKMYKIKFSHHKEKERLDTTYRFMLNSIIEYMYTFNMTTKSKKNDKTIEMLYLALDCERMHRVAEIWLWTKDITKILQIPYTMNRIMHKMYQQHNRDNTNEDFVTFVKMHESTVL
ncbi:hypothetical protein TetV_426 [Tetraselmis virus 1]|uniref:Uncharacterized protein n=1 Tax=Tetraselmis virus 1 TaxID=2060617 RepID=A0A2P0VNM8_9VIRU|nr:hypothetical protein QJ968_gp628 [Tetraselmis virus 1]AUF82508.1 hypothetical protein TetV_426 [Tetraselmis virus 1]